MKNNMSRSSVELTDLPDEILLMIFRKLNNIDLLYSLEGVNNRLTKILHDPIFTNRLNFLRWSSNELIDIYPAKIIHTRFCLQTLPEISRNIKWLDLEASSMLHILRAAHYPNLSGLGLYNVRKSIVKRLFRDGSLCDLFQKQIRKLVIGIDPNDRDWSTTEYLCDGIFSVFPQLTDLIFTNISYELGARFLFNVPSTRFTSSTLAVLSMKVQTFDACLYILDGRFNQLRTLSIDVVRIHIDGENFASEKIVPNLIWFSLSCAFKTFDEDYKKLILPLLARMSNLEKLDLDLTIFVQESFLDGNHLKRNILDRMSKLNQLTFNIHSIRSLKNQIDDLPSQEEIAQTFEHFPNSNIVTRLNYFQTTKLGQCHVYTYPFLMQHYEYLTNHFPGGFYPYVRVLYLYDEQPFEHEFFLRISQSFPSIAKLSLINDQAQIYKDSCQSVENERRCTLIKYSHLVELDLIQAHDDYVDQFLSHRKTFFANKIYLRVNYQSIAKVTHHFTRDSTRMNCGKMKKVFLLGNGDSSIKCIRDYLPCAEIR